MEYDKIVERHCHVYEIVTGSAAGEPGGGTFGLLRGKRLTRGGGVNTINPVFPASEGPDLFRSRSSQGTRYANP